MSVARIRSRVVRRMERFVLVLMVMLMLDRRISISTIAVSVALQIVDQGTKFVHKSWVGCQVKVHERLEYFLTLVVFGYL